MLRIKMTAHGYCWRGWETALVKNRNTSGGQDFRIYLLQIHLQDKAKSTLNGII